MVILTRAGLGLDPQALKKLSGGVFRLAFIPCLVEATTAAVFSHLLLGFPWAWGFMLGYVYSLLSTKFGKSKYFLISESVTLSCSTRTS